MRILIADESNINRKLLMSILNKQGYEFLEVISSDQAMQVVFQELPDIILFSVNMLGKKRGQLIEKLRNDNKTRDIPIIFLLPKTETEKKSGYLELGASDYIVEPFEKEEVIVRVKNQLKIKDLTQSLMATNKNLIDKQKRMDEDLKAVVSIQQGLLPMNIPQVEVFDMAWKFRPCDQLGGDIFGIFRLDENNYSIYMLDVSGHGVSSALIAISISLLMNHKVGSLVKGSLSVPPYYYIASPVKVLEQLDEEYSIELFNKFFTIAYLILNIRTGILQYSIAGHPRPIVLHPDGNYELLNEGGTIIGLKGVLPFEEGKKQLLPGDKLFLYTDGIVEYQRDEQQEMYGEQRLYQELQKIKDKPVKTMLNSIMDTLMDFGNQAKPQDDMILLGLEFKKKKE